MLTKLVYRRITQISLQNAARVLSGGIAHLGIALGTPDFGSTIGQAVVAAASGKIF